MGLFSLKLKRLQPGVQKGGEGQDWRKNDDTLEVFKRLLQMGKKKKIIYTLVPTTTTTTTKSCCAIRQTEIKLHEKKLIMLK